MALTIAMWAFILLFASFMSDADSSGLLGNFVARAGRVAPTGGEKRKKNNKLPRVFLALQRESQTVGGAFVATSAYCTDETFDTTWHVQRFVQLTEPFKPNPDDFAYKTVFYKLKPEAELSCRQSTTMLGEVLNHHYLEHAASTWLLWPLDAKTYSAFVGHDFTLPHAFTTGRHVARGMGVWPDVVGRIPLPEELWAAAAHNAFGSESAGHIVELVSAPPGDPAGVVVARDSLRALSHEVSGAVAHRYDARSMIKVLKFATHLKPSANVSDALADAVGILFPDEEHVFGDRAAKQRIPVASARHVSHGPTEIGCVANSFRTAIA